MFSMRAQTARPGGAGNAAPHAGSSRPSAAGGIPVASGQKRRREKERAESASLAQGPRGDSAADAAWAERAGRSVKSLNSIGSFRWQLISLEAQGICDEALHFIEVDEHRLRLLLPTLPAPKLRRVAKQEQHRVGIAAGVANDGRLNRTRTNLDDEAVVEIFLARLSAGPEISNVLALRHNLTCKAVRDIWNMRTWQKVTCKHWTQQDQQKILGKLLCCSCKESGHGFGLLQTAPCEACTRKTDDVLQMCRKAR
mmetsp:Transcript_33981/g.54847  ORF Transcript_33981/g.54847 Transcript_33981/m.54847 type:complete len:254 (+) Transcript_33981:34-795(+)